MDKSFTRKRHDDENDRGGKRQKAKTKAARRKQAEEAEEQRLTALLFGGSSSALTTTESVVTADGSATTEENYQQQQQQQQTDEPLFEIDRTGREVADEEQEDGGSSKESTKKKKSKIAKSAKPYLANDEESNDDAKESGPVWVDEEDAEIEVNLLETDRLRKLRKSRHEEAAVALSGVELEQRMRQRYQTTMERTARTDWAELDETPESDDDEAEKSAIQGTSMSLLRTSGQRRLEPNQLDIVRCPDANLKDPSASVVRAVHFHPGSDPDSPLLLTAGLDKTLRFFQVGEEESKKIHGIHFPKLPIYSASFLGSTGNVVVTGRRKFFYIYDAAAGKLDHIPEIVGRPERSLETCTASPDGRTLAIVGNDGFVILFDTHSKQWIADLKLNGNVRTIAFSPDGRYISASGSDGDVYKWDLRSRKCVERFANADGTACSALAVSSQHTAVGAHSGVVNLYSNSASPSADRNENELLSSAARTPIKSILNLQSGVHATRFNGDGQILAMTTKMEQRGLKLMHVPTATVFANWPTNSTPLGYVWSMDFSPESKYFAMGNDKGKCLLYRLKHYS
eukprot:CAMPEP_0172446772 /NCGR_PEP_ID=MMETSP1065-20121228/6284_1 /TAXON_ID=265537 /ORGANISM="Amphiprora paludosa, Strain CCMP125" /LENGTH=568 /DNA_ID=CAMNT_0013197961 /DNA_START=81 /DNA_END=1787 /DNA_ORIENTATION=+